MTTIRAMERSDLGRVAELSAQLGYPVSAQELERRFAPDGGQLLAVALSDGTVAGWMQVQPRRQLESETHAEITGLVVDAAARRRGVGRALIAEAERWARERGFGQLRVRSNVARAESHPFYEGIGFTRAKTQHVYAKPL